MRHHILYLLGVSPEEYLAFARGEPSLRGSQWEVLFRSPRWLATTTDDLERPGEILSRKFGVPVFELGVLENGVRWYVFYRGEGEVDRYSSDPSTYAPGGPAAPSTFRGNPAVYDDLLEEGVTVAEVRKVLEMQRVAGREFLVRFGRLLGLPDPLASSGRMGTRPIQKPDIRALDLSLEAEPEPDVRALFEEWERSERAAGRLVRTIDVGRGVKLAPIGRVRGKDGSWFHVDRGGRSVRGFELWDLKAGRVLREIPVSTFPAGASSLALDPSGEFASGLVPGRDGTSIFVAELEEGAVRWERSLGSTRREFLGTAASPDGRLSAAFARRWIGFFDERDEGLVEEVRVRSGWAVGVAFLPGGTGAVHWADGRVQVRDAEGFASVDSFDLGETPDRETVHDLLSIPGTPYLAVACRRGVRIRDVQARETVRHLHRPDDAARRRFLTKALGGAPRPLRRLGGIWVGLGDDEVYSIDYHHWRNLLATGNADGWIRLWNLETEELAAEFYDLEGPIRMVKFSQDGRTLWTEGGRGVVRCWSLESIR